MQLNQKNKAELFWNFALSIRVSPFCGVQKHTSNLRWNCITVSLLSHCKSSLPNCFAMERADRWHLCNKTETKQAAKFFNGRDFTPHTCIENNKIQRPGSGMKVGNGKGKHNAIARHWKGNFTVYRLADEGKWRKKGSQNGKQL